MGNLTLLPLERELIRLFLDIAPGADAEIEVHSRQMTGVGFYTRFSVARPLRTSTGVESPARPIDGPYIESPQIPSGAGSLLWVHGSGIHVLEVYTHDDPFPEDLKEFRLVQP